MVVVAIIFFHVEEVSSISKRSRVTTSTYIERIDTFEVNNIFFSKPCHLTLSYLSHPISLSLSLSLFAHTSPILQRPEILSLYTRDLVKSFGLDGKSDD